MMAVITTLTIQLDTAAITATTPVDRESVNIKTVVYTVWHKCLMGENFDEFDKFSLSIFYVSIK